MVVWSKILPLLAAGVGVLFLVNAFTRPTHAQQTAGALTDTFGSIGTAGASIAEFGKGIGAGLAGLFQPVWEIANLFEKFSSLSGGSANVSPVAQQGYWDNGYFREGPDPNAPGASSTVTVSGSSSGGYVADASDTGGGTLTSGNFGGTDTSSGWGI